MGGAAAFHFCITSVLQERPRKINLNMILILLPKQSGDKNENKPCTTDRRQKILKVAKGREILSRTVAQNFKVKGKKNIKNP